MYKNHNFNKECNAKKNECAIGDSGASERTGFPDFRESRVCGFPLFPALKVYVSVFFPADMETLDAVVAFVKD